MPTMASSERVVYPGGYEGMNRRRRRRWGGSSVGAGDLVEGPAGNGETFHREGSGGQDKLTFASCTVCHFDVISLIVPIAVFIFGTVVLVIVLILFVVIIVIVPFIILILVLLVLLVCIVFFRVVSGSISVLLSKYYC